MGDGAGLAVPGIEPEMEMSAAEWQRVKGIVAACLELPERERVAHLERACGEDVALLREAESILASYMEAGSFLERPATGAPEAGLRLGPWLLEEEVGVGGMGRIYRASRADGLYAQKVAVKVLRRGMDTDRILAHFQAERQILASLNHPHIARLLDGGATQDGRPFFVMEFIDGQPLDRWMAERGPGVEERLRLFQQVCGAVQYAHQRLVVHRDIKPANILVTGDGVPKLVDFGIAKLLGSGPEVTLAEERMLTPAYASPEQMAGAEVTTASDVYSLGLVLRQLVAGVGGDIETVVGKALEEDPGRRYGSAGQLAEEIQRYLDGLPVEARKPTAAYRMARFVGRNRVLAGAAVLLVLALAGGLAATAWQYRIAQYERRQAEARFSKLRKLANSVIYEFHDSILDLPGSTGARALMLSRALEYLDGLAGEAGADPALRLELAAAYRRVGDVQGRAGQANLGQRSEAERSYAKSIALLEGVPGGEESLARVLLRQGGDGNTKRAVAIAGDLGKRALLADAYFARADLLTNAGDLSGAMNIRKKDMEIRRGLLSADPGNRRLEGNLALVAKRMGGLLIRMGQLEEAYGYYAEALRMERGWVAAEPLSVEARTALTFSSIDIGLIRMQQGRMEEALGFYREAVAVREALFTVDGGNYRTRVALASACWRMGDLLLRMGRGREALPLLRRAEMLLAGPGAPRVEAFAQREDLANIRFGLARVHGRGGVELLKQAREEFESLAREAPGREDLRESLAEVSQELRKWVIGGIR